MGRRLLLLACTALALGGTMPSASAADAIDDWNQAGQVDSMTFRWLANGAGSTRQAGEPRVPSSCHDPYSGLPTMGTLWFRADPLITHSRKQVSGRFTVKEQDRQWLIAVYQGPSPDQSTFVGCATNVVTLRFFGDRYGFYDADPTQTYWFQLTTAGEATVEIEYNCFDTDLLPWEDTPGACTQAVS